MRIAIVEPAMSARHYPQRRSPPAMTSPCRRPPGKRRGGRCSRRGREQQRTTPMPSTVRDRRPRGTARGGSRYRERAGPGAGGQGCGGRVQPPQYHFHRPGHSGHVVGGGPAASASGRRVIKAFNTTFASRHGNPTSEGEAPLDAFIAGDDADARARSESWPAHWAIG